jgi:hypothetical protein
MVTVGHIYDVIVYLFDFPQLHSRIPIDPIQQRFPNCGARHPGGRGLLSVGGGAGWLYE